MALCYNKPCLTLFFIRCLEIDPNMAFGLGITHRLLAAALLAGLLLMLLRWALA